MATLPSKNALNDLTGGYYSYWTDGTTEGRATVAVLLGSTDAQAAAASFSSLALGTPLSAANGGTGLTSISTLLNSNVTPATLGLVIGTNVQAYDADLTAIAALSSADGNFIVGSATGWVAESGATARTSLGLGNVENTALSTWAGSTSITTLGTITTGTVPAARVSAGTFQSGAFVFAGAVSGVTTLAVTTSATIASDITLASGSITSASGAISFGNENLSGSGNWSTSGYIDAGRARMATWSGISTYAWFGHEDFNTATGYAFVQGPAGSTFVNAESGQTLTLQIGGANAYRIDASGNHNFQAGNITTTGTLASGNATVTGTLGVTGAISATATGHRFGNLRIETSDPGAGNTGKSIWADGAGSGVLGFVSSTAIQFDTGALATTALTLDSSQNATFAGKVSTSASTTARASLNIPSGTAPTTPTNGDIWSDGSDILVRLGGTTYTLTKA